MSSKISQLVEVTTPLTSDMVPIVSGTGNTKKVQLANLVRQHPDLPTDAEKAALVGTSGTPNTANPFVTNSDTRNTNARTPTAHAASHAAAGSDPLVISPSQVTGTAVITTDARLSDARTPTAHASSHASGGTDAVTLAWVQVSKGGSSLADLLTRSAGDLSSGTLPVARLASGVTTTITTTQQGVAQNFALALSGDTLVRCTNATDLTLSGLAGGVDGQRVTFVALGVGNVLFQHQDAGSTAANRFTNLITVGNTPITAGGHATYVYDGTSATWRLLTHDQGARLTWTPIYTASASMTFGTVTTNAARYYLKGRVALITFDFQGTVGGTPDLKIFASLPNGWSAPVGAFSMYDAGIGTIAIMQSRSGTTTLEFYSSLTGAANWVAGVQRLLGTVEVELT